MRYVYIGDDRVYPSLTVPNPVHGESYELDQAPDDGRWRPDHENDQAEPVPANDSTIDSNKEVG